MRFLKNSLNHSFKVIGITETRIKSEGIDFKIDNYSSFHTPTEADAGGSSLYIEKNLKRTDLESFLYVSKILESTFAEISRGSSSIIIGSIYKHPSMNPEDFFSKLGT